MNMRIKKLTYQNRNDFHFVAECNCGKESSWGDGYADLYYQQVVFPNRLCPHCGMSEYGETGQQQQARWAADKAAKTGANHTPA